MKKRYAVQAAVWVLAMLGLTRVEAAQLVPPISIGPSPAADSNVVATWSEELKVAPIAKEQGTYPLHPLQTFPGQVFVPGQAETPFAGMTVAQVGWTGEQTFSMDQPFYEVDLNGSAGTGQWTGSASRQRFDGDFDGKIPVQGCQTRATYCSSNDGILAQEAFRVQVEGRDTPIVVTHWGNFMGQFEYWSADWYEPSVDMSFELILFGNAPDTAPMTFDAIVNSATAENVAQIANGFVAWTP